MGKNSKNNPKNLKDELLFDQVSDAIKKNPKNYRSKLEELGFTWVDDGYGDEEEIEERYAVPTNPNQEFLVAYFEGHIKLTEQVLNTYLTEKYSGAPNYPLIRRYYKQGNPYLKDLLLFGLKKDPTNLGLIDDLSFFHQHKNILKELIQVYLLACMEEKDLGKFEELTLSFYYGTDPDGYDALHELSQRFGPYSEKGTVITRIIKGEELGMDDENGELQ